MCEPSLQLRRCFGGGGRGLGGDEEEKVDEEEGEDERFLQSETTDKQKGDIAFYNNRLQTTHSHMHTNFHNTDNSC